MKLHRAQIATIVGVGIVVAAGAASWSGSAETVPEVLRAQRIELVDANGTVRARLNVEPDGEAVFRIVSQTGEIRVKLGGSDDGSGLVLMDEKTEPAVHVLAKDASVKLRRDGREKILEP